MKQKFVTFSDYHGEQIIVFPDHLQHLQFAKAVQSAAYSDMEPISGGFVVDGECVGKSISLRLESRPEDTELLKTLMGNREEYVETRFPPIEKAKAVNHNLLTKN
ncbi:MAG TPA: hypothetical protein EYN67_01175, partial [Flavobacteriales bacterium]|nr:hypothetical protein [Flavobacteriales bacterium]